ncbi:hypothetical protein [Streptomyces sparsogenes]|uniref:hypothetical protein n=1 Tax=Streptomyces sparsogenes TaxID=67365 RepID=UPI003F4CEA91
MGLLGDAAFTSSPMSGQGTGLALVGAYLLAGELAAAGWHPDAGFARYEARMRSFVEANQEIGRLNARSRDVPGPDAEPRPDFRQRMVHGAGRARDQRCRAARLRGGAGLRSAGRIADHLFGQAVGVTPP